MKLRKWWDDESSPEEKVRLRETESTYVTFLEQEDVRQSPKGRSRNKKAITKPDLSLGKHALSNLQGEIELIYPRGSENGRARHDLRLGLIGWLLQEGIPEEAIIATVHNTTLWGSEKHPHLLIQEALQRIRRSRPVRGKGAIKRVFGSDGDDSDDSRARANKMFGSLQAALEVDRYEAEEVARQRAESELPPVESAESKLSLEVAQEIEEQQRESTPPPEGDDGHDGDDGGGKHHQPTIKSRTSHDPSWASPQPEKKVGQKKWMTLADLPNDGSVTSHNDLFVDDTIDRYCAKQQPYWLPVCKPAKRLVRFEAEIKRLLAVSKSDTTKHTVLAKVIGGHFALGGIDSELVRSVRYRFSENLFNNFMSKLLSQHCKKEKEIKRWKGGKRRPTIPPWKNLNSMAQFTWRQINGIKNALIQDLEDMEAPGHVALAVMASEPWGEHNKKFLQDLVSMARDLRSLGQLKVEDDTLKLLDDAAWCFTIINRQICSKHGEVKVRAYRCDREVSCRFCRSRFIDWQARWIQMTWCQDNYILIHWDAPTQAVRVPQLETKAEKETRKAKEVEQAKGECYGRVSVSLGPEKHMSQRSFEVTAKKESGARRKRKSNDIMSDNALDRCKYGLRDDPSWTSFKEYCNKFKLELGARAYGKIERQPNGELKVGAVIVIPGEFLIPPMPDDPRVIREADETGINLAPDGALADTFAWLQTAKIKGTQTPLFDGCKIEVVTNSQAADAVIRARSSIGRDFDQILLSIGNEARRVLRERGAWDNVAQQHYNSVIQQRISELTDHPFLKRDVLKPVKAGAAVDRVLKWYGSADIKDWNKHVMEETQPGLEPGRCPVPVLNESTGHYDYCRRLLESICEIIASGAVISMNKHGSTPILKDVFDYCRQNRIAAGNIRTVDYWTQTPVTAGVKLDT